MSNARIQDFGYEIKGEVSVSYYQQEPPEILMQALETLFSHSIVKSIRWEQGLISDEIRGGLEVEVRFSEVYDHLGIIVDIPGRDEEYHWSFIDYDYHETTEAGYDPTVYLEELNGISLGKLPEQFETFSEMLENHEYDEFLVNSFGRLSTVNVEKVDGQLEFYVHPIKFWN